MAAVTVDLQVKVAAVIERIQALSVRCDDMHSKLAATHDTAKQLQELKLSVALLSERVDRLTDTFKWFVRTVIGAFVTAAFAAGFYYVQSF